ncbi:MAG: hypothetical protein HPY53_00855 [Brevinematales bacterium]|nr:hypothetical protein [Brevinematales bacterium]
MRKAMLLFIAFFMLSCGGNQTQKPDGSTNALSGGKTIAPEKKMDYGDELVLVKEGTTNEVKLSEVSQTVEGKIDVYDDGKIYLTKLWETKSAVSFEVIEGPIAELKKLNGKIVIAEGKVSKTGAYSGTIRIKSYKLKK